MDLRQVFAANLRGIRHAKGISQEELAHEAGVNRTYMSKIERGGTWVGLEIIDKPASADLVSGQTDEADFGFSYEKADVILNWLLNGYSAAELAERGFVAAEVEKVRTRLDGTHWKRRLPTVAMLSGAAIGESYLRPVDY